MIHCDFLRAKTTIVLYLLLPGWTTLSSMNTARALHTATILPNGKVLVAGGSNGNSLNSTELYDPSLNTWIPLSSMNTARDSHTATLLLNGKVLVAGGILNVSGSNPISLNSAELYDPSLNTWTTVTSMSTARNSHTATILPDGKVLVAGGLLYVSRYNSTSLNSAELYDPSLNTWTTITSMSTARNSHTATILPDGKVLVTGGSNDLC